ncbi:MAG: hypothetical protein IJ776_08790 [Paludibacteraceae bacterium]|nr:hypothetical protein [Paludibacteraceae bacterium]
MTGNGTTTKRTPTISTSQNSNTVSAARTATTTLVAPDVDGYTFDGWYESNNTTLLSNNKEYTYYPTSATEVHACYTRNITVSATASPTTIPPSTATDITFTVTTNAPSSGATIPYYYLVYGFGSSDANTRSNLNGDHAVSSGLTTTPSVTLAAGTWYTRVAVICNSVVIATSDKITITSASSTYTVSVGVSPAGTGTVSSASVSASPDSWSSDITATPNAGYKFVNWTYSGGEISLNGANTANPTQIKATSTGGTLTANFTAATYRITLDNQSATTSGTEYMDVVYNTTTLSSAITKPTKTNYSFGGYYTATGGGGTQIIDADGNWLASKSGFTDSSKKSLVTEDKRLYAKWTETKYAVTVAVDAASHAAGNIDCSAAGWVASKSGTAQIGNVTNVTITVPAGATGYTYTGGSWTLTGGVTLVSGSLTNPSITVKATAAGTATFTYAEDLNSPWIVAGGNKIVTSGTTWRTTADANNKMLKKTGHSTESVVYFTVPVSAVCSGDNNGDYQFKLYNTTDSKWYALNADGHSYYLFQAESGTEKSLVEDGKNIELRAYVTGDYVLKLDYSASTPKLTVTWPTVNQLQIYDATPADATNTNNFDMTVNGTTMSKKLTLNAETTYLFKIVYNSQHYGKNSTTIDGNNKSASGLSASGSNISLATTVAGDYTFTFNTSTKDLSVTYPTIPDMTGTLSLSCAPAVKGNGTTDSPYIIFKDKSFTFTASHSSKPSSNTDHIWYQFTDDATDKAPSKTELTYSPATSSTGENKTLSVKSYYQFGPEGHTVRGNNISATAYYQVVAEPTVIATLSADEVRAGASFTGTITATGTNLGITAATYTWQYRAQGSSEAWTDYAAADGNTTKTLTMASTGFYEFRVKMTYGGYDWYSNTMNICVYNTYQVTIIDENDVLWLSHIYAWRTSDSKTPSWQNAAYPGINKDVACTQVEDNVYVYEFKTPVYTHLILNDGKKTGTSKTNDIAITANTCITLNGRSGSGNNYRWAYTIENNCDKAYYRIRSTVTATGKTYYSNVVSQNDDKLSYYAAKTGDGSLTMEKMVNGTWTDDHTVSTPATAGVYTATFNGSAITSSSVEPYTGDYYLYSQAVALSTNHTGEGGNIFTHFVDGNAAYTSNPYYYYWVDWIGGAGKDVTATVGNEINNCLAQKIETDNLFPNGVTLGSGADAGANVRFAYNPFTNYFDRAALAGSSDKADRFLMVYDEKGKTKFLDTDTKDTYVAVTGPNTPADKAWCGVFDDVSDWVYELNVKATGESKVIAHAAYYGQVQHLFGEKEVSLINEDITDELTIRLIYDFKTNRIITAWVPDGEITNTIDLDAAMMIVRKGNRDNGVQQITLSGSSKVNKIEQVFTLLELEQSDVTGSPASFFLSLPYDCKVSEIFGIEGGYLNHWALLRYDGATRAQKGLFNDSGSFWTIVGKDETLKKGGGYLLQVAGLSWDKKIERNNKEIAINRLYFPSSKVNGITLESKAESVVVPQHEYSGPTHSGSGIDHTQSDRDWNLVGVPTYSDRTATFSPENNGITTWGEGKSKDAAYFYYNWNGSNWIATATAGMTFKATYSYMMQWAGTISWAAAPSTPAAIARRHAAEEVNTALMELQLLRGDQLQDRTYIQMADEATSGFDMGHDLTKMMNTGDNLYTRCYNGSLHNDLAANNVPMSTTEVPLIVKASVNSDYTFRKSKDWQGVNAVIYDRTEDRYIDLDFRDYTVKLQAGTYEDRFVLQISHKSEITTSTEQTRGGYSIRQSEGRLFVGGIEGNADVALYDLVGHLLYHGTVSNGESIPAPEHSTYLIRINGETQMVHSL